MIKQEIKSKVTVITSKDGGKRDFTEECWALIASVNQGDGVVLKYHGASLEYEIEGNGLTALSDLGLDNAPDGLSVWEGRFEIVSRGGNFDMSDDGDPELIGNFRLLNETEHTALRYQEADLEKRCPECKGTGIDETQDSLDISCFDCDGSGTRNPDRLIG